MASNSETGHAKNVANFEQLLIKCTSYNGSFIPSNPTIQIVSLNNTLSQGKEYIASVNSAEGIPSNASALKPFSKLITRIGNVVKASCVPQQAVDQVTNLIRKLQGRRATPRKTDEEKPASLDAGKKLLKYLLPR